MTDNERQLLQVLGVLIASSFAFGLVIGLLFGLVVPGGWVAWRVGGLVSLVFGCAVTVLCVIGWLTDEDRRYG